MSSKSVRGILQRAVRSVDPVGAPQAGRMSFRRCVSLREASKNADLKVEHST